MAFVQCESERGDAVNLTMGICVDSMDMIRDSVRGCRPTSFSPSSFAMDLARQCPSCCSPMHFLMPRGPLRHSDRSCAGHCDCCMVRNKNTRLKTPSNHYFEFKNLLEIIGEHHRIGSVVNEFRN